ncbi:DUF2020 domain-containing protein [Corynebacterium sp. HMSC04H06]|uniref:DUF2020 domain-containing protein n=1 Tax=Corynebacterium sp. HMSC04H06 TaxID=1581050 RepID=UPI0008A5CD8B|nr:DUF2020 domain-containing protein [Corynebacterium sp. HMSC04H06]OFS20328.1 hypothetical protein HMPREF3067_07720 [Corynebacterium sp. HMSC04H06]
MSKSLLPAVLTVALGLAACSEASDAPESDNPAQPAAEQTATADDTSPEDAAAKQPGDGLPVNATAEAAEPGQCPYLDGQWLAETNGQRLTDQAIDPRFSTPACVFWSYPEDPQATVIVREMPDRDAAMDIVDWAAPVDATELAEFDGWSGGRGVLGDQAVFAVQKDNRAVAVWTNQLQTVKAESIAREAIANLGL